MMEKTWEDVTKEGINNTYDILNKAKEKRDITHKLTMRKLYEKVSDLDFERAKEGKRLLDEFNLN